MNRQHPLPAEVYALVEQTPATVLLEGGNSECKDTNEKPWTQLFTAPLRICAAHRAAEMQLLFAEIESAVAAGLSAAGFFSYECGSCFEPKAGMRTSAKGPPLAWFGIYERGYAFDHETGKFAGDEPPELARFRAQSQAGVGETTAESGQRAEPDPPILTEFALSEAEYAQRIAMIHEWIRAGDVYQLNFTAPWRVALRAKVPGRVALRVVPESGAVAALYTQLRARQPVDYGAFLHWRQGHRILSFSPELFFRVDVEGRSRRIVTRPMKGTARRGRTTREDRAIAEWLRNDPKNRSENVMIVDLLRNDLGRLAQFGTVLAEKLFAVERYPTLWQMTSTVSAELRPEVGFHDIFRALFPCGSVTGAPKVRAMQLLAELECEPRGVYTGAIGFFSPRQTVFNVAIRTLEMDGAQGTMGAGSGIVIDSDAAEEYRECLLKAEFLTRFAQQAASQALLPIEFLLIETMLWDGIYPLIELHLDRLMDSAEYFGVPCEHAEVKTALLEHARGFRDGGARKVRLLMGNSGVFHIGSEALTGQSLGRVRIAEKRTNPDDPYLYHKTTQRPHYALAYQQAAAAGFDDVLFFNLRGELTEGAISNVFIEKSGRLLTPPIECGLLAGVYRRHLLETRPDIKEHVLREEDLRHADAIYLTNALRGMRRVEIDWDDARLS
jgi:para-aminobenzoate synthetase/4-amino-4-deoxychorismate lyase